MSVEVHTGNRHQPMRPRAARGVRLLWKMGDPQTQSSSTPYMGSGCCIWPSDGCAGWISTVAYTKIHWIVVQSPAVECAAEKNKRTQTGGSTEKKCTPKRLSLRKVVCIWCSLWGSAFLRYSAEATGKARTETRDGSLDQRVCLPRQQKKKKKKTCLGYASGRAVWAQSSTLIEIVAPCVCVAFLLCRAHRGVCAKREGGICKLPERVLRH